MRDFESELGTNTIVVAHDNLYHNLSLSIKTVSLSLTDLYYMYFQLVMQG